MELNKDLVWTGRIIALEDISGADYISQATVVCGAGGKWRAVVKKGEYSVNDSCLVFLPDSLLPECDQYRFMEKHNWRVKLMRFKGAASEVLIMPLVLDIGVDVTEMYNVTKYFKPVPAQLSGIAKGYFPNFLRKTDELNYQVHGDIIEKLRGKSYYITQKCDGSSTTVYRYKGEFGVCSRNFELEREEENGYWKVARKYDLENRLPEGMAVQFETCGPGIQSNSMGLKEIDGFVFSAWDIKNRRYFIMSELFDFCRILNMKMVSLIDIGKEFNPECIPAIGEGKYANGKEQEGVVIRSQENIGGYEGDHPISFKVINLNYEK